MKSRLSDFAVGAAVRTADGADGRLTTPCGAATVAGCQSMNGKQGGDPAKLANTLIQLAGLDDPPLRFAAGADAIATFEQKAQALLDAAHAHHDLSTNLAIDEPS